MYWPEFAAQEPELAALGRKLLAEEHGYVFLATVAKDGSPRVHPIVALIGDRGPIVAVKQGSPKLADLRRDPRLALHSTVHPPDDEEFSIRGIAHELVGPEARQAALEGATIGGSLDKMVLFELELLHIGHATWPSPGVTTRRRWRPTE